jgi:ribosomal protein L19E
LASVGAGPLDQRIDARDRGRVAEQRRLAAGRRRGTAAARLRSVTAFSRELRSAAAVRTVASSRSFDQGLDTKSVAPRFIASTAI